MRDTNISLYKEFGTFMGQPIPPTGKTYRDLKNKTQALGLKTRFFPTSYRPDDIGDNEKRLNIAIDERFKVISEISLG